MIIADTSVWVDHFREQSGHFADLLANDQICLHPFVLGELALGGLPTRGTIYETLLRLREPPCATAAEVLAFISWANMPGTGVGYVDTHLLVSARSMRGGSVLTTDKRLRAQAEKLGLAYER
jgi:predicted nucleic acid-binding protein